MTPPTLEILFVCTGNQCRSPFAAAYLNAKGDSTKVTASSAGTLDLPPTPAAEETRQAALEHGVDVSDHLSRYVGDVDLSAFDLIFGFDQQHAAELVVQHHADPRDVFLLGEPVADLRAVSDRSPREAVLAAKADRSGPTWNPGLHIEDPIGRPGKVHLKVAGAIAHRVDELLATLSLAKG